jgi:hypothetical protein
VISGNERKSMPRFSLPIGDMKFDETFGEDAKTHCDLG